MASDSPGATKFFVLDAGPLGSPHDADVDKAEPIHRGEGAFCPKCGAPVGSFPWLPPFRAALILHGNALGDFMETAGHEVVVSERFMRAFRAEALTGLSDFHPLEVVRMGGKRRGPKPADAPRYQVTTASSSRAAVDLTRSTIRYATAPTCDECRYGHKDAILGFTLEPGTWRGEDIFRPRGLPGCLVVSERFEHFVRQHGFTHMRLTPTEEYVWNPLGPEPLPGTRVGSA